MGYLPTIPESMSFEGKDFLNLCLKHDASQRATASELLDHTFTKVLLYLYMIVWSYLFSYWDWFWEIANEIITEDW